MTIILKKSQLKNLTKSWLFNQPVIVSLIIVLLLYSTFGMQNNGRKDENSNTSDLIQYTEDPQKEQLSDQPQHQSENKIDDRLSSLFDQTDWTTLTEKFVTDNQ